MAEHTYSQKIDIDNELKLRNLLLRLPRFASEFFRGIESTTSSRTRIAYAYDLIVFLIGLKKLTRLFPVLIYKILISVFWII